MALVERRRASSMSHQWMHVCCYSSKKILTPFPSPCSFGHKCYKTSRDEAGLPRSEFNLAKFISWKVVEQTRNIIIHQDHFVYKTLLNVLLLGFSNIKTHFEPPISISLIFRNVNAVQAGFSSPDRTFFSDFLQFKFVAQTSMVFHPTMFMLALSWPLYESSACMN